MSIGPDKRTVSQLPNCHASASFEGIRRQEWRWYQLMMEPSSTRREPDENSREDGRGCKSPFYEQENAYSKRVPGSMYRKSALYTPGSAGKSESDIVVAVT